MLQWADNLAGASGDLHQKEVIKRKQFAAYMSESCHWSCRFLLFGCCVNKSCHQWNGRSLCATGKIEELTHELDQDRWHVIGLSEVDSRK